MRKDRILWADDEIDLLRAYVLFLEEKGYEVVTATNGKDAVELCQKESFDIIFLDENMPGLSGLETLALIKDIVAKSINRIGSFGLMALIFLASRTALCTSPKYTRLEP